jgi:hypothetical protein
MECRTKICSGPSEEVDQGSTALTEYVLQHFPAPENVVMGSFYIKPSFSTNASHGTFWRTIAAYLGYLPDLMDALLAGVATILAVSAASVFFPELASQQLFDGVALN